MEALIRGTRVSMGILRPINHFIMEVRGNDEAGIGITFFLCVRFCSVYIGLLVVRGYRIPSRPHSRHKPVEPNHLTATVLDSASEYNPLSLFNFAKLRIPEIVNSDFSNFASLMLAKTNKGVTVNTTRF